MDYAMSYRRPYAKPPRIANSPDTTLHYVLSSSPSTSLSPPPTNSASSSYNQLRHSLSSSYTLPPLTEACDTWNEVEALWGLAWFGSHAECVDKHASNDAVNFATSRFMERTLSLAHSASHESFFGEPVVKAPPPPAQKPPPNCARTRESAITNIPGNLHSGGSDTPPEIAAAAAAADAHPVGRRRRSSESQAHTAGGGTWRQRQYRLMSVDEMEGGEDGSPAPHLPSAGTLVSLALQLHQQQLQEAAAAKRAAAAARKRNHAGADTNDDASHVADEEEGEAVDAAWRWRFSRRWHAEQTRANNGEQASVELDPTEDTISYIHAGGGAGWNVPSVVPVPASAACTSSLDLGMLLDVDDLLSRGQTPFGRHLGEATMELDALNQRAAEVLKQQHELEEAAESRWRQLAEVGSSEDWIGSRLQTVDVDDWGGPFHFVLIKVYGLGGKQHIIVRGRNSSTEGSLLEEAQSKMVQLASQCRLPTESMRLMGGGLMEWSRRADRCLYLHSGYVSVSYTDCRHHTTQPSEILNLAGVLTKQRMPMSYKLIVVGSD